MVMFWLASNFGLDGLIDRKHIFDHINDISSVDFIH